MTTDSKLIDFISTFRNASTIIEQTEDGCLRAEDIINLSSIKRHLEEMDITKADIFAKELKWDCGSDKLFKEKGQAITAECKRFEELYIAKRRRFDKQCSSMEVASLIKKTAEQEFKFELDAVCEEASRWQTIYNKYNDITRLYNSRNCRPGQEDMEIIKRYREELYDMVGHPIYLEKVNEEHNEAYKTWKQKDKEAEEIHSKSKKRFDELLKKVDDNVLYKIYGYSKILLSAFVEVDKPASSQENDKDLSSYLQEPKVDTISDRSTSKKRGGQKMGRYSSLKECVTSDTIYEKIHKAVDIYLENENQINRTFVYKLFKEVQSHNGINKKRCTKAHFGDLFRAEFPERCSYKKGKAVYGGKNARNSEISELLKKVFPEEEQQDSNS